MSWHWTDNAACKDADPALFFPERGGDHRPARAICAACTVADQCLDAALADWQTVGIWAGTTAQQRKRMQLGQRPRRGGAQRQPIKHGTSAGYVAHLRRKEPSCQPCKDAAAAYRRDLQQRRTDGAA